MVLVRGRQRTGLPEVVPVAGQVLQPFAEPPVRDRAAHQHVPSRLRREAAPAGRSAANRCSKSIGDAEPVGRAGQLDLLALQRVQRPLAEQPRRQRPDVDHPAVQVEVVEPDHRAAAVVAVLVVRDVHVHVVAGGVAQRRPSRRPEVTVQRQEDLVVVLDQLVPQPAPVVGHRRDTVRAVVDQLVRGEDDRQLRVPRQAPSAPTRTPWPTSASPAPAPASPRRPRGRRGTSCSRPALAPRNVGECRNRCGPNRSRYGVRPRWSSVRESAGRGCPRARCSRPGAGRAPRTAR